MQSISIAYLLGLGARKQLKADEMVCDVFLNLCNYLQGVRNNIFGLY
jgi:hypothetical protein